VTTSTRSAERAASAARLLQALDAHEAGTATLHAVRRAAADYKRRLGGGARRAHEDCIRDMNTGKRDWLATMRGNTQFMETTMQRAATAPDRPPMRGTRNLAILSCSKAKRPITGRALTVYDGPAFRMVRDAPVDVLILSTKYGLISGAHVVRPYDLTMPAVPDAAFVESVRRELADRLAARSFDRVLILLGERYARVLGPLSEYEWGTARLTVTEGRIGERLHALRAWLDDVARHPRVPVRVPGEPRGKSS
jgi:hypothetical protein